MALRGRRRTAQNNLIPAGENRIPASGSRHAIWSLVAPANSRDSSRMEPTYSEVPSTWCGQTLSYS
jgi:transposase